MGGVLLCFPEEHGIFKRRSARVGQMAIPAWGPLEFCTDCWQLNSPSRLVHIRNPPAIFRFHDGTMGMF